MLQDDEDPPELKAAVQRLAYLRGEAEGEPGRVLLSGFHVDRTFHNDAPLSTVADQGQQCTPAPAADMEAMDTPGADGPPVPAAPTPCECRQEAANEPPDAAAEVAAQPSRADRFLMDWTVMADAHAAGLRRASMRCSME